MHIAHTAHRARSSVDSYFNTSELICSCGRVATIAAHNGDDSATRVGRSPVARRRTAFSIPQSPEVPALSRSSVPSDEGIDELPDYDSALATTINSPARKPSLFDAAANATNIIGAPCESRKELTARTGPTMVSEIDNGLLSDSAVTISARAVVQLRRSSVKLATKRASKDVFGAPSESVKEARMLRIDADRSDSKADVSTCMKQYTSPPLTHFLSREHTSRKRLLKTRVTGSLSAFRRL